MIFSLGIAVLGRLKAFLPMMDEANRKLFSGIEEKGREQFDIEVVDEDSDKPHIEMVSFYLHFILHSSYVLWLHIFDVLVTLPTLDAAAEFIMLRCEG